MKIIEDMPLNEFNWWGGAQGRANKLTDEQMQQLEQYLEEQYPEGIDATELNGLMWFDFDDICEMLGINGEDNNDESLSENKSQKITKKQLREMVINETKKALNEISLGMIGRASGKAQGQNRTNQRSTMLKNATERINQKYQPLVQKYNEKHYQYNNSRLRIYVEPNAEYYEELPILHIGIPSDDRYSYMVDPKTGEVECLASGYRGTIEDFKKNILGGEDTFVRKIITSAIRDFIELMSNYNVTIGREI